MGFRNRNVATVVQQLHSSACWKATPLPSLLGFSWACSCHAFLLDLLLLGFPFVYAPFFQAGARVSKGQPRARGHGLWCSNLAMDFITLVGRRTSCGLAFLAAPCLQTLGHLLCCPCWGQERRRLKMQGSCWHSHSHSCVRQ